MSEFHLIGRCEHVVTMAIVIDLGLYGHGVRGFLGVLEVSGVLEDWL